MTMLRRKFFLILIAAGLLAACAAPISRTGSGPSSEELVVFAAASLTEVFRDIGRQYGQQKPGVEITFNFAGSQQLAQQLALGAPADVFASADLHQMDAVVETARIVPQAVEPFAGNRLVVIFPLNSPHTLENLEDLARPGLKLVLPAPQVPAGRYARQFLTKAESSASFGSRYGDQVLENVVSYEQSVRAVLSKVLLGEADAGILYASDISAANASELGRISIPPELNVSATYYIAPLTDSSLPQTAQTFIDFILSPQGQEILSDHGLQPVR